MAAQDLASLVTADISESGPDLLNRQVDPSQRLDEASLTDLIPAVASVAAVGVDLGWCEDPDVVVVTQGMHQRPLIRAKRPMLITSFPVTQTASGLGLPESQAPISSSHYVPLATPSPPAPYCRVARIW